MTSRELIIGDEEAMRAFLAPYQASSMHILNNIRTTGLKASSQESRERKLSLYEGRYYGYFENGQLMAMVAHWWNQNLVVQCPHDAERILPSLLKCWRDDILAINAHNSSDSTSNDNKNICLGGVFGPREAVLAVKALLGLNRDDLPWACNDNDQLMATTFDANKLQAMVLPNFEMASPTSIPESTLVEWLVAFEREAMGYEQPDLTFIQQRIQGYHQASDHPKAFILKDSSGTPLSLIGTSCRLDNIIQIGPVWTPPELRGKGFARQLLARIFLNELEKGYSKEATLVASDPFAIRCYQSVGFRTVGSFQYSLFNGSVALDSLAEL